MPTFDEWLRSPNYQYIYANMLRVRVATSDVAITFGSLQEVPDADKPYTMDHASVVLSFAHAKLLAEHLTAAVKGIEQSIGPILVPDAGRPHGATVDNVKSLLSSLNLKE